MTGELKPRILRLPIAEDGAGETIKEYLKRRIGFSSTQLSRFKYRKNGIMVNGEKRYVNYILKSGDVLEIRLTQGGEPVEERKGKAGSSGSGGPLQENGAGDPAGYIAARDGRLQKIWVAPAAWLDENYPLRILYEDQDILAADKPSGVVCHPSPGHFDDTLSNQVAQHLGRIGQELDVRVTGRLDKDTSGIVIFALNTETAAQLIRQRQASMMSKLYIARVRGHFSDPCVGAGQETTAYGLSGTVDKPLRRESPESFRMVTAEDGKAARTHYRVLLEMDDGTSLVSCRIEHGRTHQIRVHMASIGHPLVGDRLYGTEAEDYPEEGASQRPAHLGWGTGERRTADEKNKENTSPYPTHPGRGTGERRTANGTPGESGVPLMLHAFRAELIQPYTAEKIFLESPLPAWAEAVSDMCLTGRLQPDASSRVRNSQKGN